MLVHVITDNHLHIRSREELASEVESSVQAALRRFAPQITRVEVHLSDENAQKGGGKDKQFPDNKITADDRRFNFNQLLTVSYNIYLPFQYRVSE